MVKIMTVCHGAAWAILGWLAVMPSVVTAQGADSTQHALRELIEGLPPSARVRLGSGGERWDGRITDRASGSVVLLGQTGSRSFQIPAIDSLWLRSEKHEALLAAVGLGALVSSVLFISGSSENRAATTRQAGYFLLGAASLGLFMDTVTEEWKQWYPE